MENVYITSGRLDTKLCSDYVTTQQSGGVVVFVGTVRNHTKGRSVSHLEFECYEEMALKEMSKIVADARLQWELDRMIIHHRIGRVPISEEAVVIAVSSTHRKAAFEACEFAIDTLKKSVPIWKKEVFEDGEVWVSAHP